MLVAMLDRCGGDFQHGVGDARNVSKVYTGGVEAVKGVSLAVSGRRIRGARRALGLRQVDPAAPGRRPRGATSGEISIGDRRVNDVPPKDRDIAMVFQSYALYPHMSVRDNMAFGLNSRVRPRGDRRARAIRPRSSWGSPPSSTASPARSPADSGSGWRWGGPSCAPRGLPVRRAAQQPGRRAARADARGDRRAPPGCAPPWCTSPTTRWRR